jgi:hypothetical protein
MKRGLIAIALCGSLATAAQGQQAPTAAGGVQTSTDPARAAAIEKDARELKARAGNQPKVFFRGKTDAGLAILSGGSNAGDRVTMHADGGAYSLWVVTVAKPSGAYLADAKLRIVNLGDKSVALERTMEGPWLLAALPAGNYEVSATFKADGSSRDQTLSNRVTVATSGQSQVVLRFDSPAKVGSEIDSPYRGDPFGAPPVKK